MDQASAHAEYASRHAVCPKCKGDSIEVTTKGFIIFDLETFVDSNRATCACGWQGRRHDLVPKPSISSSKTGGGA